MHTILNIYCDGGARGNPGPAAIGVVILNEAGSLIGKTGRFIGETTNNIAEYSAVIEAFELLKKNYLTAKELHFYLDSLLVVSQLNGIYKIKKANLKILFNKIKVYEKYLDSKITYINIPRAKNSAADAIVNSTLDSRF